LSTIQPNAIRKARTSAALIRTLANWPTYYAAAYGLVRQPLVTYRLRNGLRFRARPRTLDTAVLKDVLVHQVYGPPGFEIHAGDVVVDIGAHIGFFAASAARAADRVRVFAFEPCPDNFALLTANLSLNASTASAFPAAVSARAGVRELHLSSNPSGHSFYFVEAGQPAVTVQTVSLADLMAEHGLQSIDLLKMDCEGGEYEILESSVPEPLSRVRRIVMEAHSIDEQRTPARIERFLDQCGYDVSSVAKADGTSLIWASRGVDP
jgi:FkbM family methyltransferase